MKNNNTLLHCLIALALILSLSACHKDPLVSYNRSMYQFNTLVRPYTIQPLVATYTALTPAEISTMLLNSQRFVKQTFNTPYYLIKDRSPLNLWNRWIINLLLGGFGSTAISANFASPLPQMHDTSWPIVLPLIGPMGMIPLAGAILGNTMLALIIPSSSLRLWSILSALAMESSTADLQTYIARQPDPYAVHLKLMREAAKNPTYVETFILPDL